MSQSPGAVVRELFTRINSGDTESALELMAPDVLLVVPPDASAEPDTYEGHDGARRYFAGFDGVFEEVRFDLLELEETTADTVLAEVRLSGRGAATGIPVAQATVVVLTVRDGLVTFITPYGDREAALDGLRGGSH